MRQIRFKARAVKTNEWVEGLYAIFYETITGDEGEPVGYRQYHSIYVIDEPWRPDSGHWEEVYPQTLSCRPSASPKANTPATWCGCRPASPWKTTADTTSLSPPSATSAR